MSPSDPAFCPECAEPLLRWRSSDPADPEDSVPRAACTSPICPFEY